MTKIKNWKKFCESMKNSKLDGLLDNPENLFILYKNGEPFAGMEYLEDILRDSFLADGLDLFTDDDIYYNISDIIDDLLSEYGFEYDDVSQEELDNIMDNIMSNLPDDLEVDDYKLYKRDTLEDGGDDYIDNNFTFESKKNFVIVGKYNGKTKTIDYADDEPEARFLVNEFKKNKKEGWENIHYINKNK